MVKACRDINIYARGWSERMGFVELSHQTPKPEPMLPTKPSRLIICFPVRVGCSAGRAIASGLLCLESFEMQHRAARKQDQRCRK